MKTLPPTLFLLVSLAARAQPSTYVVDDFDPAGPGGYSYSGAVSQITSVWGNWFGSAFQSLSWDASNDASNNPSSGSLKISALFNSVSNQFEVYNGHFPLLLPLNGLQ